MGNIEMWKSPSVVPSISYKDLDEAIEWLTRVFGFRERSESRLRWPGGGMTWFEIGDSLFNISTPDRAWDRPAAASPGLVMKVYVDDVDKHFAQAKAQGAHIVSEPEDGFWGGRIYRCLDYEDNKWEFSQAGVDISSDLWELPPGATIGK